MIFIGRGGGIHYAATETGFIRVMIDSNAAGKAQDETSTLESICQHLQCQPGDILEFKDNMSNVKCQDLTLFSVFIQMVYHHKIILF